MNNNNSNNDNINDNNNNNKTNHSYITDPILIKTLMEDFWDKNNKNNNIIKLCIITTTTESTTTTTKTRPSIKTTTTFLGCESIELNLVECYYSSYLSIYTYLPLHYEAFKAPSISNVDFFMH